MTEQDEGVEYVQGPFMARHRDDLPGDGRGFVADGDSVYWVPPRDSRVVVEWISTVPVEPTPSRIAPVVVHSKRGSRRPTSRPRTTAEPEEVL